MALENLKCDSSEVRSVLVRSRGGTSSEHKLLVPGIFVFSHINTDPAADSVVSNDVIFESDKEVVARFEAGLDDGTLEKVREFTMPYVIADAIYQAGRPIESIRKIQVPEFSCSHAWEGYSHFPPRPSVEYLRKLVVRRTVGEALRPFI